MNANMNPRRIFSLCLTMIFCTLMAASAGWAFQDDEESELEEVGLRGILEYEVPDGLTDDDFSELGGSWEEWSASVAEETLALYEDEELDLPAQRELLTKLQGRLDVMEKSLADARYKTLHETLTTLHGRLSRRVALATAILDAFDMKPEDVKGKKLEAGAAGVTDALSSLEADLKEVPNGTAWLPYVRAEDLGASMQAATDSEAALPVVQDVLKRLGGRTTLESDVQKEFLSQPAFLALETALNGYVDATAFEVKPVDEQKLREQLVELVEAVEQYESSNLDADAARMLKSVELVSESTLDGGDQIRALVAKRYLNYNLHVFASEQFLSKLVHEERQESGKVNDQLDEARVYGSQSTTAVISIDTKPSNDVGLINLTLNGRTQSRTSAVTSRATIFAQGDHRFRAARPVIFDGTSLQMKPVTVDVTPRNSITGASTTYDGGLFAGTARRRAMSIANSRRARSNAHTRRRIRERVLPEFEAESEKAMLDADEALQQRFHARLKEAGVFPKKTSVATSESHMRLSSRILDDGELAGDLRNSALPLGSGAALHLHESLLNNALSRMNFAGRTMTDDEIREELERFVSVIAGKEISFDSEADASSETAAADEQPPAEEGAKALVFADKDPVRVRFEGGVIELIIRAGFVREGQDDIPAQVVTVPLTYTIDGDKAIVKRGRIRVSPIGAVESTTKQIAFAGIIGRKMERSIPDRTRDTNIDIERTDQENVTIAITDIKALNGWLTVWVE